MITIVAGSSRKNSNTLRLAKAIRREIRSQHDTEEVRVIDFEEYDIPFLNKGGMIPGELTHFQQHLVDSMAQSGMIIILSPEYNWFPSAEVVNMLHRLGSRHFLPIWENKVFALAGVSSGRGGRIPAMQLSYVINKLLNVFNCQSAVSPKIFESQMTPKVLNEEGESLGNEEYDRGLHDFVAYNLNFYHRWGR